MSVRRGVFGLLCVGATLLGWVASPDRTRVSGGDVHRFVDAYYHIAPTDSACPALDAYFAAASPCLEAYSSKFHVGVKDVCRAIRAQPKW